MDKRKGREPRPAGRRPVISYESVVDAAVAIGLRNLTVTAVAERLGVSPGAIYHHVDGLAALENEVFRRVVAATAGLLPTGENLSVEDYLVAIAQSFRLLELSHPGLAAYMDRVESGAIEVADTMVLIGRTLMAKGVDPHAAANLVGIVGNISWDLAGRESRTDGYPLTGGWSPGIIARLRETPAFAEVIDSTTHGNPSTQFEWIVRAMVRGVLADLGTAPWVEPAPGDAAH